MRIVHADIALGESVGAGTTVLVISAVAPLHAEPKASSEQVSQAVAGHLATILETREGWRRVRLEDRYEGWMHEGYLGKTAIELDQASDWLADARRSLGCTLMDERTGRERALPLGARVSRDAKLIAGEAVEAGEIRRRYPPVGDEICASAARWFGSTSYQWGGITPWGADCSGMVQTTFGLHGIALSRDARQQALLGDPIPLMPAAWRAGDLLFFSDRDDGRITHVALVAQTNTLMHVAIGRGGFWVEHLEGTKDPYTIALMGRLREARRILAEFR